MKKTKVICTMGPNTNDRELIKQLALSGMDIARFNFSHGDHEEQAGRFALVKSVREEINKPIATLLDTKGPEIRTGVLKDDKKVTLKEGQKFTLTTRDIVGDDTIDMITYAGLPADVANGNTILIDDGLIELRVEDVVDGTDIVCTVINGGELGSKKGVNVPNVSIKLPGITDKDKDDIIFGIEQGFDFIAASFVRNAACIQEIKQLLWEHGADIPVIAKIENAEGIENLDEIIKVADGIMVARVDMGVEIPAEDVPHYQKEIIKKCNATYKPVITATQMLDSMIRNPRPTRAEVTDVANAIYDGTDAIMLSGESANGDWPVESVQTMARIATETEEQLKYETAVSKAKSHTPATSGVISRAACNAANELKAAAIVSSTKSGATARRISQCRPECPIVAVTPSEKVAKSLAFCFGVYPVVAEDQNSTDAMMANATKIAVENGFANSGDTVVIAAGLDQVGSTNLLKVSVVE